MQAFAEDHTPSSSSVRAGLKSKWTGPSYQPASSVRGVDDPERATDVAGAEAQVLVELRPVLAVEVDVEELALPQRLGVAGGRVQAGHLLVPDLGFTPTDSGRSRVSMNASAWPIVGSRMSPRGSLGLGSIANRRS